jgi:hypothetical protein
MRSKFQLVMVRFVSTLVILSFVFVAFPQKTVLATPIDAENIASDNSVMFIENVGQFAAGARYQVRGGNSTIWLAEDALWVSMLQAPDTSQTPAFSAGEEQKMSETPRQGANIKLSFEGANLHPTLEPINRLETSVNYFIGNDPDQWKSDVPAWGGVRYKDLYPGIDLEVSSKDGQVVQRVVASEGADLSAVKLRVEGMDGIALEGGQLLLTTTVGKYTLPLLLVSGNGASSQPDPMISGNQVMSPFTNSIETPEITNIRSGAADLIYSTFLSGTINAYDDSSSIAVDNNGSVYVTGFTHSSDFPTTSGALDRIWNDGDAYVAKLNPTGSALTYATYLGGSNNDYGQGIVIDNGGAVYVVGYTNSPDFPTTIGALDRIYNGGDAFVVKLNAAGSALLYATYLGGTSYDEGEGIAIDTSGAAYITGYTTSSDFPTTLGALDRIYDYYDSFVVKLNATGSALAYSTFLGGNSMDYGRDVVIDTGGSAYVTGYTASTDFPTTPGAFDTSAHGNWDTFVVKLNSTGKALTYSTLLGGSNADYGEDIASDTSGAVYVTGYTTSSEFPTTAGAFSPSFIGGQDAFVVKLNSTGSALTYGTFLGGSNYEYGQGITVDTSGAAYVTGQTYSSDFPTTTGAFDSGYNENYDVYLAKLNPSGSSLSYATFLGGSDYDNCYGIAVNSSGSVYIAGYTKSPNFPITAGAFDTIFSGDYDIFLAKMTIPIATTGIPVLSSIFPTGKWAGRPGSTLTLYGSKFVPGSVVRWNGSNRVTTYVNSGQLTAAITTADLATASINNVTVFNPAPGGGTSVSKVFTVKNDVPVITGLYPLSKLYGKPGFTLNVYGKKFGTGAKVRWNGVDRPTTFVNMYLLKATISAADIASAGTANVKVFNPAPYGGVSNTFTFTKQ